RATGSGCAAIAATSPCRPRSSTCWSGWTSSGAPGHEGAAEEVRRAHERPSEGPRRGAPMSSYGTTSAGGVPPEQSPEYRVAHLQERLAVGEPGELGVRVVVRGGAVLLTGTVPSAPCREEVLRTVREELTGPEVHCDLVVADTSSPAHAEELT